MVCQIDRTLSALEHNATYTHSNVELFQAFIGVAVISGLTIPQENAI